jgi:WD40 repeat protein
MSEPIRPTGGASDGPASGSPGKTVPEIFSDALGLPAEERAAFLDCVCGGDRSLREEVESLLLAHAGGDSFLQRQLQIPSSGTLLTELLGGAAAGSRIGPYEILRQIGAGGMGAVYLGERVDEAFRKQVAIKLIRPGLWGTDAILRFRMERQVLANLEHPGIARLIDGGSLPGDLPYLVMEHVDGLPIDQYCRERALGLAARLGLFLEVCDAVQYAHQNLVIHRDIKPGNIFVDRMGRVKLLDFGIAKVLDETASPEGTDLTVTSHFLLTPRYASPEQVLGLRMTIATDVYSLGVVLYELLTGGFPYDLESQTPTELRQRIASEAPVRPSRRAAPELSRRLTGDLDTIILKALHKEPSRRYATVEDFAADIRRHMKGDPVQARPDTAGYRTAKFFGRNKALGGAVLGVVLALATGLSLSLHAYRKATLATREAEWQAYVASLAAGESSLLADQVSEAASHLETAPAHLRSWEWGHLHSRLDHSLSTFQAHRMGVTQIAFLPGGGRFVTVSIDSTLKVWMSLSGELDQEYGPLAAGVESAAPVPGSDLIAAGLGDGRVLLVDRGTRSIRELQQPRSSWALVSASPDGSRLACGFFDGVVRVWSMPAGVLVAEWKAHASLALTVYSPDSKLLATAGGDGLVTLYDARTNRSIADLQAHARRVRSLAFSADGSMLVSGSIDQLAHVWDVRRREIRRTFRGHQSTVGAIAFGPGGDLVATAGADNRLLLWSIATGEMRGNFRGHVLDVTALAGHPDGSRLISGDWGGTLKSWDWGTEDVRTLRLSSGWLVPQIYDATWDPEQTRLTCATNCGFLPTWSRSGRQLEAFQSEATCRRALYSKDGSLLVTTDDSGRISVLGTAEGKVLRNRTAHAGPILGMALAPDERLMATASADSTVKVWTFPELDSVRSFGAQSGPVHDVEFSPDGTLLASGGGDATIRLWDPSSGDSLGILQAMEGSVRDIAFDPSGGLLASASQAGTVQVWSLDDHRLATTFHYGKARMSAVAWSGDGARIAAGGSDGIVRLLDVATGRETIALHGHVSGITSLRFGRGDASLVSTSLDGTARIWERDRGDVNPGLAASSR